MSTNTADSEVALGTVTNGLENVIDLIGRAGDSADSQTRVIESCNWALLTNTSNQVEAGLADTLTSDIEGVDVLTGSRRVRKSWGRSGRSGGGNTDS